VPPNYQQYAEEKSPPAHFKHHLHYKVLSGFHYNLGLNSGAYLLGGSENAVPQLVELFEACIMFQVFLHNNTFGVSSTGSSAFRSQLGEFFEAQLCFADRIHNLNLLEE